MKTQTQMMFPIAGMKPPAPSARRGRPPRASKAKRDEVLVAMNTTRAELIEKATEVAVAICKATGHVTSVQLMAKMREDKALHAMLDACDPRWVGGCLIPSKGWVKLDYVNEGHRGRAIPRWTRKS